MVSLGLYGEIFYRNVQASGVIPQISLIMGAAAGGHVYSPALTDFVVMVDQTSQMFITGPDVIKTVTGEDVSMEDLGGARVHNTTSGNAHYLGSDEQDAIDYVKALLSYLPSNNMDLPPAFDAPADLAVTEDDEFLDTFIPDSANQPYDMHTVVEHLVDDGEFLEVHAPVRAQHRLRLRPDRGCADRRGGQPAAAASPAAWTSTPRRRRPVSSGPATRSTSRC